MSRLEGHPLFGLMPPKGKIQDYANHCLMYWFDEMVRGCTNSAGEWEWQKLAICPVTGRLMYLNGYHPVAWHVIDPKQLFENEMYEKYNQWLIAKHLLGEARESKL